VAEVRYYADENVDRAVARGLRRRGVDILTAAEVGMLGRSDEEQLAYAMSDGRVLVTQDDDFLTLAADGRSHAGIVYAPQRTSIGHIVRGLLLIQQVIPAEDMVGFIEYL
jgi:uncharacterized protein with PIN domain